MKNDKLIEKKNKYYNPVYNIIISIDPGENTAVSVFIHGNYFKSYYKSVKDVDITKEWKNRLIIDFIKIVIKHVMKDNTKFLFLSHILVIVEGVRVYNSTKSITAAISGKLEWLYYLVGGIVYFCDSEETACLKILDYEWKGNLQKFVVKNRVNYRLTDEEKINLNKIKTNEHIYDSIGIGLWYLNRF